jgi:hypothetical protein
VHGKGDAFAGPDSVDHLTRAIAQIADPDFHVLQNSTLLPALAPPEPGHGRYPGCRLIPSQPGEAPHRLTSVGTPPILVGESGEAMSAGRRL